MFSTKMKLVGDCIIRWFDKNIKSQYLEINLQKKYQYEKNNPIYWENGKCVICKFLLEIIAKIIKATNKNMSYLPFIIRKEQKFLRNILSETEPKQSSSLELLNP